MAEETAAPATPAANDAPRFDATKSYSAREAAGLLGSMSEEDKKPVSEQAAPVEGAGAAQPESAEQADAAGPEVDPPGETKEDDPGDDLPSIEPPRSWTKSAKEAFKALPRAEQEALVENATARERDIRRTLDEQAAKSKAIEAKEAAAEQARQRYEAALPNLLQAVQAQHQNAFSDIKSWDDVAKMQQDDPLRYQEWTISRDRQQAMTQAAQQAAVRRSQETAKNFETFKTTELEKFFEKAPEFADPEKAPKLQAEARALLEDIGVTKDELKALMAGQSGISIHDHRVQLLIRDAMRYRTAQAKAKTTPPVAKPVPPVQRPGIASNKGEARASEIQTLGNKLERTGSVKDAVALLRAQRRA